MANDTSKKPSTGPSRKPAAGSTQKKPTTRAAKTPAPEPAPAAPVVPAAPGPAPMLESTARNYAMWAHLSALLSPLVSIPGIAGALLFWLLGKDRSALVDEHGKESVNFQLTIIIGIVGVTIVAIPLTIVTIGIIWILLGPALLVAIILAIVWQIQASMAASRGDYFRYPINWRMVR